MMFCLKKIFTIIKFNVFFNLRKWYSWQSIYINWPLPSLCSSVRKLPYIFTSYLVDHTYCMALHLQVFGTCLCYNKHTHFFTTYTLKYSHISFPLYLSLYMYIIFIYLSNYFPFTNKKLYTQYRQLSLSNYFPFKKNYTHNIVSSLYLTISLLQKKTIHINIQLSLSNYFPFTKKLYA